MPPAVGEGTTSKTRTALMLFSVAIGVATVEHLLRIAIFVAFWPAIALSADVDRELTANVGRPSSALGTTASILLVFMIVELLLVAVGFHFLRLGRAEFPGEHSRRITHAGVAIILYVVVIFLGNISLATALATSLPWIGYTLSSSPARYAAFTTLNALLAALAGLSAYWIPEKLFSPFTRKVAFSALVVGVAGALEVVVAGLAILSATPFPLPPNPAPFLFAIPLIVGEAIATVSLSLWLVAYVGTLGRFQRGEIVAKPPAPVYSTPPPYIPHYVPPSPPMRP